MKRADLLREAAILIQAGVPLSAGLAQLIPSLPKPLQRDALQWISQLDQGRPLSAAMATSGESFGPGALALLEAGEASGQLATSLQDLASESEIQDRRRSRLVTALIYPLVLIHAAAFIPALGTWFQADLMTALFQAAVVLLPFYGLCGLAWFIFHLRRQPTRLALLIDRVLLKIPFLGTALTQLALARWSRILGCLIDAGLRWEDAISKAAQSCGNAAVAENLGPRSQGILTGRSVAQILQDSQLADGTTLATIQTGEASGTLPRALRDAAERAEFQAQQSLDRMAVLLPILCYLTAVALIVVQIFRILAPILQSYQELLP